MPVAIAIATKNMLYFWMYTPSQKEGTANK